MIESPYQILEFAKTNRPVDRIELGIHTPKTNDGLELLSYGFFSSVKK